MPRSEQSDTWLMVVALVCAVTFAGDIIALNVVDGIPSGWWVLAVPVGLVLVPVVGLAALVLLLLDRRRA